MGRTGQYAHLRAKRTHVAVHSREKSSKIWAEQLARSADLGLPVPQAMSSIDTSWPGQAAAYSCNQTAQAHPHACHQLIGFNWLDASLGSLTVPRGQVLAQIAQPEQGQVFNLKGSLAGVLLRAKDAGIILRIWTLVGQYWGRPRAARYPASAVMHWHFYVTIAVWGARGGAPMRDFTLIPPSEELPHTRLQLNPGSPHPPEPVQPASHRVLQNSAWSICSSTLRRDISPSWNYPIAEQPHSCWIK